MVYVVVAIIMGWLGLWMYAARRTYRYLVTRPVKTRIERDRCCDHGYAYLHQGGKSCHRNAVKEIPPMSPLVTFILALVLGFVFPLTISGYDLYKIVTAKQPVSQYELNKRIAVLENENRKLQGEETE